MWRIVKADYVFLSFCILPFFLGGVTVGYANLGWTHGTQTFWYVDSFLMSSCFWVNNGGKKRVWNAVMVRYSACYATCASLLLVRETKKLKWMSSVINKIKWMGLNSCICALTSWFASLWQVNLGFVQPGNLSRLFSADIGNLRGSSFYSLFTMFTTMCEAGLVWPENSQGCFVLALQGVRSSS